MKPIHVIPLKAGYDWRKYFEYSPYLLCLNGEPLEVQGPLGNRWRPCTFQPVGGELETFAAAMRGAAE
jgi:hypothetical protein